MTRRKKDPPRLDVKVEVWRGDVIEGPLEGTIAWLKTVLEEVPEDCRSTAYISSDSYENYDGAATESIIFYTRLEDDLEYFNRIDKSRAEELVARKKNVKAFNQLAKLLGQPTIEVPE